MAGSMSVAVVQNATRTDQRQVITTLENLAADMRLYEISSPAIVFVGQAASLAVQKVALDTLGKVAASS